MTALIQARAGLNHETSDARFETRCLAEYGEMLKGTQRESVRDLARQELKLKLVLFNTMTLTSITMLGKAAEFIILYTSPHTSL